MRTLSLLLLAAPLLVLGSARAETPADFLARFEQAAKQADPRFGGFSAARGEQFFNQTHGGEWSCASCHTRNPAADGKHAKTAKTITPLAPAANGQRFTDAAKVDKWFKRNCNDVLGRACTPQEKGDVLTYLLSVRP